jgi:hypothetical protein
MSDEHHFGYSLGFAVVRRLWADLPRETRPLATTAFAKDWQPSFTENITRQRV